MPRPLANQALQQFRTLYAVGTLGGLTDAELVARFHGQAGSEREDAFAALVGRHGPMVLGICRRMLRESADADDAFQAVFLVLARKAGGLRRVEGLESWLYGVTVRTAKEARRRSARRRATETRAVDPSTPESAPIEPCGDLLDLLDEELDRLPGRYRDPLMLCELEGLSRRDAAQRLGLAEGTLSSRLFRGRSLLRDRLSRRGVALGTAPLAASLSLPAKLLPPGPLADTTVRLALRFTSGGAALIPPAVASLAATNAPRLLVPAAFLAGCALTFALAVWASRSGGAADVQAAPTPQAPATAAAPAPVAEDPPLPEGASLRFGSPRFRHPTPIESLAVSPDGQVAVACSGTLDQASFRVYDLTTGLVRFTLDDRLRDVVAVAISPDGQTLAATTEAVTSNPAVHLFDLETGRPSAPIAYPAANPGSAADLLLFTPDGRQLVVKAADGHGLLRIDLETRGVARTFPAPGTVFAAAVSPDGQNLVAAGFSYEGGEPFALRWDVGTGRALEPITVTGGTVRSLAYAPDGATIAAGVEARHSRVSLVRAATGIERQSIAFPDTSTRIRSLAFSPDSKTLAMSDGSSTRLLDAETGAERRAIDRQATGLCFTPDGATLTGAVAATIERWDAATGRSLIPPGGESPVGQIAVTPDGTRIITLGQDGDGHVWDAQTGAHLRRLKLGWQRGFALSPDGRLLVWPEADHAIDFPDADMQGVTRTGTRLRLFDLAAGQFIDRFPGFQGDVHDLAFLDGGKTLLTVEHYRQAANVRLWDVATGQLVRSFPAQGDPRSRVWSSRLSPDGKILAVTYQSMPLHGLAEIGVRPLKLWDVASGAEVDAPPPSWADLKVMAFAPDGRSIAAATPDGRSIQLLDTATRQVRRELRGPASRVTAIALTPDGRLYTGLQDATTLAWDLGR